MTSPTSNAVALVERLRDYAASEIDPDMSRRPMPLKVGPIMFRSVCDEAADVIQSQAARIAELEGFRTAIDHGYQVNHTSKWCREQARLTNPKETT